jgi:8-oxo-dGTP pyrophosphatase MutT (NUDIX family)
MRTARAVSAGGLVLAEPLASADLVLIATRNPRGEVNWTLPKGTQEPGETLEQTALREVGEETGLEAELLAPLGTIDYWFVWAPDQTRYHKFVHYYLMVATGGDLSGHDDEVEEARWFAPGQAAASLTFANERALLDLVPAALNGAAR